MYFDPKNCKETEGNEILKRISKYSDNQKTLKYEDDFQSQVTTLNIV